jgi:hypothetical protein
MGLQWFSVKTKLDLLFHVSFLNSGHFPLDYGHKDELILVSYGRPWCLWKDLHNHFFFKQEKPVFTPLESMAGPGGQFELRA